MHLTNLFQEGLVKASRNLGYLDIPPEAFNVGLNLKSDDYRSFFALKRSFFIEPAKVVLDRFV